MDKQTKTKIKNLVLELRDDFEKEIENRLNNIGIYPDKEWKDGRSLPHLEKKELENRRRVAAFIKREEKIGIDQKKATKEFIKEASYTWINRLLGLKCMESRGLIEEVITIRPEYGDRSRYHRDFRESHPDLAAQADDGLIPCLFSAFKEVTEEIKVLFDPENEYSLIIPRYPFLKKAIQKINDDLDYDTYREDEFLGWVYQYFNSREKDRVFEEVRTKKKKIAGSDIINVTQLYTEKYMVRFLVENSLGAMWMEMYPDSHLCERWEYFVRDPNNSTREPKPVKKITFLDPACGSGHFLLYAFDLYYEMYLEEGIIPEDQIPEFILRHNLHGIDIDLRAIQLSALGLFMKAKSMQPDMKVQHMNLVSADAIMLDSEILEEFLEEFKDDTMAQELIETIWQGLENVRELGSLLKVEEQIDEVIEGQKSRGSQRSLDARDWKEKGWEYWKRDLLAALKRYYEKAAQTFDINKQMFANEACKGVQLLDLFEQRYDVVATNPPYMNIRTMGDTLRDILKNNYPINSWDLYSAFLERCISITINNGYSALITQQMFMFKPNFQELRKYILNVSCFRTLVHLGPHAFEDIGGEKVNSVMFSLKKIINPDFSGCFIKVIDNFDKSDTIKSNIKKELYYIVKNEYFKTVEGWPFIYWINKDILELFIKYPPLENFVDVISGAVSGDNDLFLRFSWEIHSENLFLGYAKGGDFNKYYGNLELSILNAPEKIKTYKVGRVKAFEFKGFDKITYTFLSSKGFNARYLPKNFVFDHNANSIFLTKSNLNIYYILGWINSTICSLFLSILNPTISFSNIDLLRLPFKNPSDILEESITSMTEKCVSIKKDALQFVPNDREFNQTAIQWGYNQSLERGKK